MTAYQESFGEDNYDDVDLPADWYYGTPGEETRVSDTIFYNGHLWECTCLRFTDTGGCNHVYRFRKQDTIEVNEDYL